jgi:hypothetical protein
MKVNRNLTYQDLVDTFALKSFNDIPKSSHYSILIYDSLDNDQGYIRATHLVFMEQEDFCSAVYTLKKLGGYLFKAFHTHYFIDVEVDEYGEVSED